MSNRHPKDLGGVGIGMAAAGAAVIGMGTAELLGQAGADLTQATQVLEQIPTTSLDTQQAIIVNVAENITQGNAVQILIPADEAAQDSLPAVDQTSPLLLDVDQQGVTASQEVLTARLPEPVT